MTGKETRPMTCSVLRTLCTVAVAIFLLSVPRQAAAQGLFGTLEAAPAKPGQAADKEGDSAKNQDAKAEAIGERQENEVGKGEQLSFKQSKVAAEMSELESRMFRLAEAIKALEPENSSRLMLGLKFAREELILHQMQETQEALTKLELNNAVLEQKQLLAKLQRLQELLLSTDLDFQMRLQRLRQIREILRRLDVAIKEEDREQNLSDKAAEQQEKLEGLRKRKATVESLIKEQQEHVATAESLAGKAAEGQADATANTKQGEAQESTRKQTAQLAEEKSAPEGVKNLEDAAGKMQSAAESLARQAAQEAVSPSQEALQSLLKERDRLSEEMKQFEADLAAEKFAAMRKDQAGNRQTTDSITDAVRELGESGAGAMPELIRASGSMSSAENALGKSEASPASADQERALASLKYAQSQLEQEAQRLLNELRGEVKKRLIEGITLMLEQQISIRQSTVALAPRVKEGSRQALTSVVGLAKSEGKIIAVADELITLVEETEFAIALPAAMGVIRDQMHGVEDSLAKGDASDEVVAAEKQIEADLQGLLEAMKQMPASGPGGPPQRGNPADQERELNRLIAELKMIRLLQVRLNKDTIGVDTQRATDSDSLNAIIRQQIENLGGRQEDVHDVMERLSIERGGELQ